MQKTLFHTGLTVCLIVFGLLFLGPARPVLAHVFLKSSQPPADQVVAASPDKVILVFSDKVEELANQITVTDASGDHFETGKALVDNQNHAILSVAIKPLPAGIYTVNYTVSAAADGHQTVGSYRFGVGAVTLTPDAPSRACATLPVLTPQPGNAISVRITSPPDNTTLTTAHLDYYIETKNFYLGSNDNYADVWLDGQRVDHILSDGGHLLDLSRGIHDLCIALVDGQTKTEVNARAGIRLVVDADTSPQAPTSSLSLIVIAIVAGIGLLGVITLLAARAYQRRK